jgi:hypothetical protein
MNVEYSGETISEARVFRIVEDAGPVQVGGIQCVSANNPRVTHFLYANSLFGA